MSSSTEERLAKVSLGLEKAAGDLQNLVNQMQALLQVAREVDDLTEAVEVDTEEVPDGQ